MGILQALLGGQQGQQPMNTLQAQDPNMATSMPQSQGVVPDILSSRFSPTMEDIGNAGFQTGINHNLVTPQAAELQRLAPLMRLSQLQQQSEETKALQMKNQMTAFQMPLMQRQMQMMSNGITGQNIPQQMQQNAPSNTQSADSSIPNQMQANASQGTPYNQDSRITMSKLAASMGNKPLSEAYIQDYQNDPNTIARKTDIEESAKGNQQRLNESQKTALDIQKNINEDADTALKTKRILGEMGTLRQNFTPGKMAGFQQALAQYKLAVDPDMTKGIATPQDQQFATATQGVDKLTAQLTTQALKEFTSRGTQMEFKTFLANNPNITMTPGGFDTLLSFMDKTSDLPLQKQQQFIKWKAPNGNQRPLAEYPDFDASWNQNVTQNIGNTLQAPITPQKAAPARISFKDMK